jgi:hypothetical protein
MNNSPQQKEAPRQEGCVEVQNHVVLISTEDGEIHAPADSMCMKETQ